MILSLFSLSTHVSDLTEAWCSRTAGNIFRYSNCPLASPYIEITIVCVESMERVSAFFPIILQSEDPQLSRTKPAPELRLSFYLTFVSSWWRSCSLLIRFVTERCTPWLCGGSLGCVCVFMVHWQTGETTSESKVPRMCESWILRSRPQRRSWLCVGERSIDFCVGRISAH